MAGVSRALPKEALNTDVFRIMPNVPDTIKEKKGIVAVYPQNSV